jgi:hypothetical protein
LRHILLSGDKPLMHGASACFTKGIDCITFEFTENDFKGGNMYKKTNDQSQTAFSESGDANKELFKKVLETMDNPPEMDQNGRKWDPLSLSLAQHFEYVLDKHPELRNNLEKQKYKDWVEQMRPILSQTAANFCEQGSAGNILQRKTLEICFEKGCSFGEAFTDACLQNPAIAMFYVNGGYK